MPWSTMVHEGRPIIEVCYEGAVPAAELSEGSKKVRSLAKGHGKQFLLVDLSEMVDGHSLVDLYYLAPAVSANPDYTFHKTAMVIPKDPASVEHAIFWRTVAANNGMRVQLFPDRPSAIAWLLAK
jgi:hypothetical protein